LEVVRDLLTLRRQIQEIKDETIASRKKQLGVRYGLDIKNLDSVLDKINKFDLTQDLPSDILHHFTLGWEKKALINLKNDLFGEESLDKICQVIDQIVWKEYKNRTNSNALRKGGSQIGRNYKSIFQVLWYAIWILIGTDPDLYRANLEVFLRAAFYLGKMNYLFYNHHEVAWDDNIFRQADDSIKTAIAIFRRDLEDLVPWPKTHDLEHHIQVDILRHGNPAGFDCQAGEAKMKIQKLKNNYSNKHAPGKDVAIKYMKTEIRRHIVSGGALNEDGTFSASQTVIQEATRTNSLRKLLSLEKVEDNIGKASLLERRNNKVILKKPTVEHVALGIPDEDMKTASKIETLNGPLFKHGGLYWYENNVLKMGMLEEVYKTKHGACYAVIEKFIDVTREKADAFLCESNIKVWRRSNTFFVTTNLRLLHAVPLLHACFSDLVPGRCVFETGQVSVREEREIVQQRKTIYKCLGRGGNSSAFEVPTNIGLGCC
jgi:hypothetical protein